jgi:hypothetical protein
MKNKFQLSNTVAIFLTVSTAFLMPMKAHANSPSGPLQCTSAPQKAWIGEMKIREIFDESNLQRQLL